MKLSPQRIKTFQKEILDWYEKNKRDLPWRRDRDPYHILISEVMLQQTQVGRVIPKYEEWLKLFPTVEALAKASIAEALRAWSGLGYNRRAIYLKKSADFLVHSSQFSVYNKVRWPKTEEELIKLPGIGEYTARALLCFAFGEEIAVVDTNVKKVILIKFQDTTNKTQTNSKKQITNNREFQKIANQLLPKGRAYEWNQALMDYASAMLKKEKIPIPKQSKFKGSNRYYRGFVLKTLIKDGDLSIPELHKRLGKEIAKEKLDEIINRLEKEGMIEEKGNKIRIVS